MFTSRNWVRSLRMPRVEYKMADGGVRADPPAASTCAVCELCGTLENLLLCSQCKGAWYCSKEHQRSHWRAHKSTCKKGAPRELSSKLRTNSRTKTQSNSKSKSETNIKSNQRRDSQPRYSVADGTQSQQQRPVTACSTSSHNANGTEYRLRGCECPRQEDEICGQTGPVRAPGYGAASGSDGDGVTTEATPPAAPCASGLTKSSTSNDIPVSRTFTTADFTTCSSSEAQTSIHDACSEAREDLDSGVTSLPKAKARPCPDHTKIQASRVISRGNEQEQMIPCSLPRQPRQQQEGQQQQVAVGTLSSVSDPSLQALGLERRTISAFEPEPQQPLAPSASLILNQCEKVHSKGPCSVIPASSSTDAEPPSGGLRSSSTCISRDSDFGELSKVSDSYHNLSEVSSSPESVATMRHSPFPNDSRSNQATTAGLRNGHQAKQTTGTDADHVQQNVVSSTTTGTRSRSAKTKRQVTGALKQDKNANVCAPESNTDNAETKLADYVVKCLNDYGICVVDHFLGEEKGLQIMQEVHGLYQDADVFRDGELVQNVKPNSTGGAPQKIREDKITWMEKGDLGFHYLGMLINRLDMLMVSCNGKLGNKIIHGRTKAMVACYPGGPSSGAGYKRHVDNPHGDGRCITCIYYLNRNWDSKKHGGILRIFPLSFSKVADIEPKFDRLLFFWSDRRNPHEVQPSYRMRFAVTVWYFDKNEREQARKQHHSQEKTFSMLLPDAASDSY